MAGHYKRKQNTLYGKVASDLENLILQGIYEQGTKIPSIREMSRTLNVSINTIKEAYSILENKQLIEGRPQKGYFVKQLHRADNQFSESMSLPFPVTQEVSGSSIYQNILREIMDTQYVPLGAAIASPSLMPVQDFSSLLLSLTEEQKSQCLTYAPTEGLYQLRRSIARKMLDMGLNITPDEIVITSGCEEALFLALSALTKPGDTVAIQTPIYCNLLLMFQNLKLKIIEIPSDPVKGIYLEILERIIRENDIKACLVISNFSNPCGSQMPDEKKKKIVRLLAEAKVPLLEDDVYGDLCFTEARPTTCRTYDNSGNTLLCSSFSKTVSPGLRIGYIVPGVYKDRIIQRKMGSNICTSSISQILLTGYLESGGFYKQLRKLRKEISNRMTNLRNDVLEFFPGGTRVTEPKGGYTLWVELPGKVSAMSVYESAIKENIAIVPGNLFSLKGYFDNFIRLDAGCYTEDLKQYIRILGAIVMDNMIYGRS